MRRVANSEVLTFSVQSPLGTLRCAATPNGLAVLTLPGGSFAEQVAVLGGERREVSDHPAARELRAYFAGELAEFTMPIDLTTVTPFTREVLDALRDIPFGETVSYGELAARIGNENAARAVGGACGRNPVPIVVPCHRVLATNRRIGGFSARPSHKRDLLALEGHAVSADGRVAQA